MPPCAGRQITHKGALHMQWIEVSVPTRSDEIDDVCAQLAELGAGGMVVEDEADFQDFLEHNHQYWD